MTDAIEDVPNPIDFLNPHDVEKWIADTARKRPWRPEFFKAYVIALIKRFDRPFSILEIGSGPGFLAEEVLSKCKVQSFTLLDFSPVMLELSRQRLESRLDHARFVRRDFRLPDWTDGLGPYDAIISMQAIHEVRHKQRIPKLFAQLYGLLAWNGLFLFCDHYATANDATKNFNLFLTRENQMDALLNAHFTSVECLLDKENMALWSATKNKASARDGR